MTAKEFVQSKYPDVKAQLYVDTINGFIPFNGIQEKHQILFWLIVDTKFDGLYIESGETESEAWERARKRILHIERMDDNSFPPVL